ncbi:hypothetical protein LCGC14_0422720 [marine sediment metagenome]|uniref:Phage protein n=1 Tax=marine sediment metagenome TaxID=412755 RepID=A0A0F9SWE1_9ZZZZ
MKIVKPEKKELKSTLFEDLNEGDCFWFAAETDANIWMKTNYEQDAVNLIDGEYGSDLCGEAVYLVNAEIHIVD